MSDEHERRVRREVSAKGVAAGLVLLGGWTSLLVLLEGRLFYGALTR